MHLGTYTIQLYAQEPYKVGTIVPILQLREPRLSAQVLALMLHPEPPANVAAKSAHGGYVPCPQA